MPPLTPAIFFEGSRQLCSILPTHCPLLCCPNLPQPWQTSPPCANAIPTTVSTFIFILSALTSVIIVGMLQRHPPIIVRCILPSFVVVIAASLLHRHAEMTFSQHDKCIVLRWMLNFHSSDGVNNNKSASVHADNDEKEPLLSSSSSPSADVLSQRP